MPGPDTGRRQLKMPQQARSRATFERFLDATEALLLERPYDEITVAEIVRRAERGSGSFYTRFGDKDGVLLALTDRILEHDRAFLHHHLDPACWVDHSLPDVVREGVVLLVQRYRTLRRSLKPVLIRSADDEEFRQRRAERVDEIQKRWRELALSKRDEIAHPDPAWAVVRGLRHTLGVLDHLLLFGPFWSIDHVDDDELVDDLVDVQMRIFAAG